MGKFLLTAQSAWIVLVLTVNSAHAAGKIEALDQPITGTAEIIHVEPDLTLWVIPDQQAYRKMIQKTRTSNTKPIASAILVQAESVSLSAYMDVVDEDEVPFIEKARIQTAGAVKGGHSEIECYSEDRRKGVLICRFIMHGNNLSEALIKEGFSRFEHVPGMNDQTREALKDAQEAARLAQKGVWRPLYGLFRMPDGS